MSMLDFAIEATTEYIDYMPKSPCKKYGQFFTSKETAAFMAELFEIPNEHLSTHTKSKSVFPVGKEHKYLVTEQRELSQTKTGFLSNDSQQKKNIIACHVVFTWKNHPDYSKISTQNKINFIDGIRDLSECVVYATPPCMTAIIGF